MGGQGSPDLSFHQKHAALTLVGLHLAHTGARRWFQSLGQHQGNIHGGVVWPLGGPELG